MGKSGWWRWTCGDGCWNWETGELHLTRQNCGGAVGLWVQDKLPCGISRSLWPTSFRQCTHRYITSYHIHVDIHRTTCGYWIILIIARPIWIYLMKNFFLIIGVKHQNIICDACKKQGIQGMRWKCTKCHDFDLCTACYMADKHDLGHAFLRIENALSRGLVDSFISSIKLHVIWTEILKNLMKCIWCYQISF